ncbi:flagellar component of cell-proximal portion of basal-body rod [Georgfuchsia toluolica]|uniref:Flagellar basal body rod protein FlgB n=1 Tax=Georgfuchsia toluolica TaxID=424218 RepID=A0A916N7I0_9PROT|nr:flagellar basal body rod protein FlgB [Georgfuchsia toluolica]CAG4882173.1 flagellar component of cell-proximal portion of basal-body rod [Georgfuchsia toluolica]
MISKLDDVLQFHQQALGLRNYRQQLLASNIANADTPGYKARDIDFNSALQSALNNGSQGGGPDKTSMRHLGANAAQPVPEQQVLYRTPTQLSVDGNTVEMDAERAQFADNAVRMEASLTFLNSQIKTLLAAIQG